jgi:hypothetical protein
MTCRPELVTAYFDEALDLEEHRVIEAHLGTCPSCRAQLASEQHIRAALRHAVTEDVPPELESSVRESLEPRRLSWTQIVVPLAACLVAVILFGRGEPWFVAREIVADHEKCFGRKNMPAKVWTSDMNMVARWFYRQGTRLPYLPERVGEVELVGARFCPLADLSLTPHLYYTSETEEVSVFAMPHDVRFSPHYRAHAFGNVVGLVRVGPVVVGVVAKDEETVQAFEGAILSATAVARGPR